MRKPYAKPTVVKSSVRLQAVTGTLITGTR